LNTRKVTREQYLFGLTVPQTNTNLAHGAGARRRPASGVRLPAPGSRCPTPAQRPAPGASAGRLALGAWRPAQTTRQWPAPTPGASALHLVPCAGGGTGRRLPARAGRRRRRQQLFINRYVLHESLIHMN